MQLFKPLRGGVKRPPALDEVGVSRLENLGSVRFPCSASRVIMDTDANTLQTRIVDSKAERRCPGRSLCS
jgi:hypothetical protein